MTIIILATAHSCMMLLMMCAVFCGLWYLLSLLEFTSSQILFELVLKLDYVLRMHLTQLF
jgi:hypothetical protein